MLVVMGDLQLSLSLALFMLRALSKEDLAGLLAKFRAGAYLLCNSTAIHQSRRGKISRRRRRNRFSFINVTATLFRFPAGFAAAVRVRMGCWPFQMS